tara:strand:- start:134 stop:319 length:186 start_codon:yes stop_codon:yes gene_type:complete
MTTELNQKIKTKNLELTKALQDVDKLTSENVQLNVKLDEFADEIIRLKRDRDYLDSLKINK